ncbi:MAG: hypothetical protein M1812_003665 [Candelaria pacifica]|nr:MAG: hypothetical protein M1812_003665 [Candelaria pacifica]
MTILTSFFVSFLLYLRFTSSHPARPTFHLNSISERDDTSLSSYHLPQNGGPIELPAASYNLSLKAITLGIGTQNYTCASTPCSTTAAPVAIGAEATLFNAAPIVAISQNFFNDFPRFSVWLPNPLECNDAYGLGGFGHHEFAADGSPTFNLGDLGFLRAAKTATVAAPANAEKGRKGEGAVDWLKLTDKGGSRLLKEVYRVETAGGKAPSTCENLEGTFEVHYAAQYWFYG